MKKFLISLTLILVLVITPFIGVIGYTNQLPAQYDNTFLAAMADKYLRLNTIEQPKIVLVGGSNLPFGIDSALIEAELGMPVVNFGLYAALGTKTNMDLSKANINKGDIVIVVPEFSSQTYSKYINAEIMLQTLEGNPSMIKNIPVDDWLVLANSLPKFIGQKRDFLANNNKPNPDNVYARSSFNLYGDIKYPRPYNILADMYDTSNTISIDKNIISADFISYFNEYVEWVSQHQAKVFISFPPVNALSIVADSTFEKRLEFYDYVRTVFDAEVISNIEDYIMNEDYFYDSNYHLNDSGVVARTAYLIGDIKRVLGDTSSTNIDVPKGSGSQPTEEPGDIDSADDLLAKDFVMSLENGRYQVVGVSAQGAAKDKLKIPSTYDGIKVYKIENGAFKDNVRLKELIIPDSVEVLGDNIFDGATNLTRVILNLNISLGAAFPSIGNYTLNNTNSSLKIYVPHNKYANILSDYFWMKYAPWIADQNTLT